MRVNPTQIFRDPGAANRYLPEGPRLLDSQEPNRLVWINIQSDREGNPGALLFSELSDTARVNIVACPGRPGFVLPIAGGDRLLVGLDQALQIWDAQRGFSEPLVRIPDAHPRTIINDAEIVPGGKAVVFGTKDLLFQEPLANLYLYTVEDNTLSLLADQQTCSNGKVFRAETDELVLFDIDTPKQTLVRYRLDVERRQAVTSGVAIDLTSYPGFPDGMCDCGDGTVIVAFYNPEQAAEGHAIRFHLTSGSAIEKWTTPGAPRVTCPVLIPYLDRVKLVLTTAIEGMPPEMLAQCPNSGCLFIGDTDLIRMPEPQRLQFPPNRSH